MGMNTSETKSKLLPASGRKQSGETIGIQMKDVIASCLVISLGIILAVHFALFWAYGGVLIYEDNKIILLIETVMSLAILGFGVERLLSCADMKRSSGASATYREKAQLIGTESVALPNVLGVNNEATMVTNGAAGMRGAITTLLVDNSAGYSESCSYNLSGYKKGQHENACLYPNVESGAVPHSEALWEVEIRRINTVLMQLEGR